MHWASLLLPLLYSGIGGVVDARLYGLSHYKYDTHIKRRAADRLQAPQLQPRAAPAQYLNPRTQPYAVDGAHIPNVNFDIGESYSGYLPLGKDTSRQYFFWFVPSLNGLAKDEITIWLTGGPGCSSMLGAVFENGPFTWKPGTFVPIANHYKWSNLTNIVYVDQPIGTGYSARGKVTAKDEVDIANDFISWWENFVKLFGLQGRKVYITGESYAGLYIPYIADGMLNRTKPGRKSDFFNVKGTLIYDGLYDDGQLTSSTSVSRFVARNQLAFPFNSTYKSQLMAKSAQCGYDQFVKEALVFPPKAHFPPSPGLTSNGSITKGCDLWTDAATEANWFNPCFNVYRVTDFCPNLWEVDVPGTGINQTYLDRADVKRAFHVPLDVTWYMCAPKPVFVNDKDLSAPSGDNKGPISRIVQRTNNTIFVHGDLDYILIAEGSLMKLNNLTWNGGQGFPAAPNKSVYIPYHAEAPGVGSQGQTGLTTSVAGSGVMGSWGGARGLTFATTAQSGHQGPWYQPSAAYRHLELLLGRIPNLSHRGPFSTQPGYPQPKGPLGVGTGVNV